MAAIAFAIWYIRTFAILPRPAYYLLAPLAPPTALDRLLVLSPHPDDESLGAAGLIKRNHDVGGTIKVVIATDGNKRHLKQLRRQETLSALKILGLPQDGIVFLDFPDGSLRQNKSALKEKLLEVIDSFKPTIIAATYPSDIHSDHAVLGDIVDSLAVGGAKKYFFLIHYHRFPRPEGFHPQAVLLPPAKLISLDASWQKFELDLDEQSAKNEAILQYKSQLNRKNPVLRGLLLSFIRQNELFVIK